MKPPEDLGARRALLDACAAVERAPAGQRNTTLFSKACWAGCFVAAGRLDEHKALDALHAAARAAGLDEQETRRTLESSRQHWDGSRAQPRQRPGRFNGAARRSWTTPAGPAEFAAARARAAAVVDECTAMILNTPEDATYDDAVQALEELIARHGLEGEDVQHMLRAVHTRLQSMTPPPEGAA